ncbi:lysylphosphatidylglycerol synthase domain-containing protein [Gimesia aquarii]|uniref:Lysylphosphatidylglycerol synthase TM region n=1 Tax=Gimesia aquarii TaxID=2527964 RepID=A0A517W014_9PLAN|nr:lysylphosphatidylglycerol synthase domain-containing protein [Gimesia aquarii]QDT98570.1 hypothetical protein V144x_40770 [Gimesia aquarii]
MRFRKKTLLWGLAIASLLIFGVLFLRFVSQNENELRTLRIIQPYCLVILFIALTTAVYVRAGYLRHITLYEGKVLGRLEAISLVCSSNLLSIIFIPFASCGFNVTYLIMRQGVSAAFVGFAMIAFISFQLTFSLAAILIGMYAEGDLDFLSPTQLQILVVFLLILLIVFLVCFLWQRIHSAESLEGIAKVPHAKETLLVSALLTAMLCFSSQALAFIAACASLGLDLNLLEGATLSSSQHVATMLSLTPAGIGFQEAVTMYVGNLIEKNFILVFGALLLIRVSIYVVSIIVLLVNLTIRNLNTKFVNAPRMFNLINRAISSLKI